MTDEDKIKMASRRAELIAKLSTQLSSTERVRVQGELSILNAKIKAANTIAHVQAKAVADRRKAAGLKEAATNAARALANIGLQHSFQDDVACAACGTDSSAGCIVGTEPPPRAHDPAAGDDPGQRATVNGWIISALRDRGVRVRQTGDHFSFVDPPARFAAETMLSVVTVLAAGLHVAVRGEELPEVVLEPPRTKSLTPKAKKR